MPTPTQTSITYNKNIRSEIMEIIDNNSKNIPEGLYLQLCNKLVEFDFDIDYGTIVDTISEIDSIDDLYFDQESRRISLENELMKRVLLRQIRNERYVINPVTGREVLRNGRIGRRLARLVD